MYFVIDSRDPQPVAALVKCGKMALQLSTLYERKRAVQCHDDDETDTTKAQNSSEASKGNKAFFKGGITTPQEQPRLAALSISAALLRHAFNQRLTHEKSVGKKSPGCYPVLTLSLEPLSYGQTVITDRYKQWKKRAPHRQL